MVVAQKEKEEYKTIVSISGGTEFGKMLSEELRARHFPVTHSPAAKSVEERIRNLIFAVEYARDKEANMVVCVSCRTPEPAEETRLEKSEKGGFKPRVNVLSRQLLEATSLCKDIACVNKFPGEGERSVSDVIRELPEEERRVPFDVLSKKLTDKSREDSVTCHQMRRLLRNFAGDKVVVEIEVFPRNPEEAAIAVSNTVELIKRLHEFNSKKKESFNAAP